MTAINRGNNSSSKRVNAAKQWLRMGVGAVAAAAMGACTTHTGSAPATANGPQGASQSASSNAASSSAPNAPQSSAGHRTATRPYTPVTQADMLRKPLADDVVELAYSPRQNAIFVSAPDWKDVQKSRVLRLDPETLEVQAEIPLHAQGFGVVLDDAADRLYLTQGFAGSVSVVDTANNQWLADVPVMEKINFAQVYEAQQFSPARTQHLLDYLARFKITDDYPYKTREIAVDQKNHRAFVPGLGMGIDSAVLVVDTRTHTLEKVLGGFGFYAVGIALDEKNGRVFVSNMQGQIVVLDAQTLRIIKTLEVQADQLLNLVYDAEHNRLFGVDQGIDRNAARNNHLERSYDNRSEGHRLFAIDAETGATLANLPTGQVPIALTLDAQNQRVFVTNRGGVREAKGNGSVSVFDVAQYQLLQTIDLPAHPNSMVFVPETNRLYVTVKNDGEGKKAGQAESVVRIQF